MKTVVISEEVEVVAIEVEEVAEEEVVVEGIKTTRIATFTKNLAIMILNALQTLLIPWKNSDSS